MMAHSLNTVKEKKPNILGVAPNGNVKTGWENVHVKISPFPEEKQAMESKWRNVKPEEI